jgi:hypothetical protein
VQFSSKEWNELMNGNMKKDSFTQSKILIGEWDTTTVRKPSSSVLSLVTLFFVFVFLVEYFKEIITNS